MKERVDQLLVKRGLFESREKAQRAIMAGVVFSENLRVDKPGTKVNEDYPLRIKGETLPYVGRGGLKLEKALQVFNFKVKDLMMLDIGASTGGFTDCALQNGANGVYALDVGSNQLAWKLRQDPRVIVMEKTNFRYATLEEFNHGIPDCATIDVSFISLKLILPPLHVILKDRGEVVALIKPQFEAGREEIGKKGIVRSASVHQRVIEEVTEFAFAVGFDLLDLNFSPITGGDGNIEFLVHLRNCQSSLPVQKLEIKTIEQVVQAAHHELKKI